MSRYHPIDISQVRTYSISTRKSKLGVDDLAAPFKAGDSFSSFLATLPKSLKATDLLRLVEKIVAAKEKGKPVIVMMGAHVIKVGLSPLLVKGMKEKLITAIALNGAGAVHDTELAYWGKTSEDVAEGLGDGSFGMAAETGELLNQTIAQAKGSGKGFGEILGDRINNDAPPFSAHSLLAAGVRNGVPATVHVAIGTDIVHQHPSADGAAIGEASYLDFKIFAQQLSELGDGGVVLQFGSTVLLPEVFLKALTVVRNLGHQAHRFSTANFDMFHHYRPYVNVLQRPNLTGGEGMEFIGHHEIMIPLLFAALFERLHIK
jgi:hypothetical protein